MRGVLREQAGQSYPARIFRRGIAARPVLRASGPGYTLHRRSHPTHRSAMVASPPPTVFTPPDSSRAVGGATRSLADRLCNQARAHLHEFVDNELDLRDTSERALHEAVHQHLQMCTKCARLEAQLRAMRLALAAVGARSMRREHASEELRARAITLLHADSATRAPSHGLRLVD
jgi:hypothetical protein